MTITKTLLDNLYGKTVSVSVNGGLICKGLWDGFISGADNEPDGESIIVKGERNTLIEIYAADIISIEPQSGYTEKATA
jgi:hypothetical protein